ncbi:SAM-dependent methyltransferase [Flaviaesturariibacter flavus]|uniref:SAM-dependent methyltransferase n=1 Tax=Flaviaesturariibacter flavus TaxID=2502780 RepID=A0A4V2NWH6_9BACT|nr:class I SAM-dependent methyltransferase [Flaviaesturariibacter flavus]TCJ17462.1 SAM-dependent methyltransferase [Flaviaesturariibacter flavus]
MFSVGTTNESVRVEWIEKTLKKIPAGLTLLDAGAGESQFKKFCGHLKYIAQDFGQYHGEGEVGLHTGTWDNSKLDIVSDITAIPLPDASVDAIMCTEVFEHIPDAVAAIREFSRLVKPGGYLLLTAPFASITHFAPYHFATGFNRYFYEKHLPDFGFAIEDLQLNGNYFEFVAQETRRVKQMASRYSGVKLSFFQKSVQHLWLKVLEGLSEKDKGSSELLSYGVHVFARKK